MVDGGNHGTFCSPAGPSPALLSPHSELLSPRGPSRLPATRAGTTFSSQHTPADPHQVPSSWVTLLIMYQVVLKATVFPLCC